MNPVRYQEVLVYMNNPRPLSNGMKLLIVTQAVDREDPILGFFHRWIEEFTKHWDRIEVICLREGGHALPGNVRIHSLGKERPSAHANGALRRLVYAWCLLKLAWQLRRGYDVVFVHMSQEYVLVAGWFWKLLGKKVYLWRNHYAGSLVTDAAALFCQKIFYTSVHSYTAKYADAVRMPVGVDTVRFCPDTRARRVPRSILFLSRMAPSKRAGMLIEALAMLARRGVDFSASFVGSPLSQDDAYYESLKQRAKIAGIAERVSFLPAVPNVKAPALYRTHEIFVNCSPSGMLDKTILEAASCGCIVLASSADFALVAGPEYHFATAEELAGKIAANLGHTPAETLSLLVPAHALPALAARLAQEMRS